MPRKLIVFFIVIPMLLSAQDWPSWRGPLKNGTSAETNWNPNALDRPPKILWHVQVGGGFGAPAVQGEFVYVTGSPSKGTDEVICLDRQSGNIIWKRRYECPCPNGCFESYLGPRTTPVFDEGRLYTLSHQGQLFCLNAVDGSIHWKTDLVLDYDSECPKYGFTGSPIVHKDLLILNASKGGMALDKKTGDLVWSSESGRGSYSTPVIFDWENRDAVMIFAKQRVVCRDAESGKRNWEFDWPFVRNDGAASADPVIWGNRCFISSAYRKGAAVYEFQNNRPKQIWFNREIRNEFGTSILHNGVLYASDGDTRHATAYLKCVDFETGEILWSLDTGHCSFIMVDEKLIVLNQWGKLSILNVNRTKHEVLSEANVVETTRQNRCWTAPVFAGGCVFVRTYKGDLVCINLR